LYWRPRLRRDIEFRKFRPDLKDIHACSIEDLFGGRYRDSEVRIFGEARDEEHEATGFDLHFGEVCAAGGDVRVSSVVRMLVYRTWMLCGEDVRHALLVCLEDTRYPLEAICEWIWLLGLPCDMRYRQTSRPLVQYQFSCIDDFCQLLQKRFNSPCVWYEIVYNLRPCLVQALIPDARRKKFDSVLEALRRFSYVICTLVEHGLSQPRLHEIHLVYEAEHLGAWTAFVQGADDIRVRYNVGRELPRFNIEDEDEDSDGAEDVVARLREVILNEAILTA
jgi:hypothetical protein